MLRKYPFLEMGWRGKCEFTILNNGILRNGNKLVKRQKACETFITTYCRVTTCNHNQKGGFGMGDLAFQALTRLYHSNEDLTDKQISMVAKG